MKKLTLICSLVACTIVGAGLEAMYPKFNKNTKVEKIQYKYIPTTPEKQLSENPEFTKSEMKKKQKEEKKKKEDAEKQNKMDYVKTKLPKPLKDFFEKQEASLLRDSLKRYVERHGISSGSKIQFLDDFHLCVCDEIDSSIKTIMKSENIEQVDKVFNKSALHNIHDALDKAVKDALDLI